MKRLLLFSLSLYQRTLSPDHGLLRFRYPYGYCRFYPSCSQYAIDALSRYGIISGIGKAIGRILRCNPWSAGGIDLITKK